MLSIKGLYDQDTNGDETPSDREVEIMAIILSPIQIVGLILFIYKIH